MEFSRVGKPDTLLKTWSLDEALKFVVKQIRALCYSQRSNDAYNEDVNVFFYDTFGLKNFCTKLLKCENMTEAYNLFKQIGFEKLFEICSSKSNYALMKEAIALHNHYKTLDILMKKKKNMKKKDKARVSSERAHCRKIYKTSVVALCERFGGIGSSSYKERFANLIDLCEDEDYSHGFAYEEFDGDRDADNFNKYMRFLQDADIDNDEDEDDLDDEKLPELKGGAEETLQRMMSAYARGNRSTGATKDIEDDDDDSDGEIKTNMSLEEYVAEMESREAGSGQRMKNILSENDKVKRILLLLDDAENEVADLKEKCESMEMTQGRIEFDLRSEISALKTELALVLKEIHSKSEPEEIVEEPQEEKPPEEKEKESRGKLKNKMKEIKNGPKSKKTASTKNSFSDIVNLYNSIGNKELEPDENPPEVNVDEVVEPSPEPPKEDVAEVVETKEE
jgi:hypothetical protein